MDKLDVILLIGRPAAGKSETIDFLKQLPDERRLQEYHIAPFEELDDFLYVWQTFEDDNIREHMGLPRRDTDANLYFLDDRIWDFFIERIDLDLSLIHISEPTRLGMISYAVFCLKKKKNKYMYIHLLVHLLFLILIIKNHQYIY